MERFSDNTDEIRPTNVVATLDDYEKDREQENLRIQRLLGNDVEEDCGILGGGLDTKLAIPEPTRPSGHNQCIAEPVKSSVKTSPLDVNTSLLGVTPTNDLPKQKEENDLKRSMDSLKIQQPRPGSTSGVNPTPLSHTSSTPASKNTKSCDVKTSSTAPHKSSKRHVSTADSTVQQLRGVAMETNEELWEKNTRYQCITAMELYWWKSLEEMRFEDWMVGRRPVYHSHINLEELQAGMVGCYKEFTPPNVLDEDKGCCMQCITAMDIYSGKSLEELRFEDYFLRSKPVFPVNIFNQEVSKQGNIGSCYPFLPPPGMDTMVRNRVMFTVQTKHQCITAMEQYSEKSIEEIRLEDYIAAGKIQKKMLHLVPVTNYAIPDLTGKISTENGSLEWVFGCVPNNWCSKKTVLRGHCGQQVYMYYKYVNVDQELLQLLNDRQMRNLVKDDNCVEGYCVRTTGQISIKGLSESELDSAIHNINEKIAGFKDERNEEKAYLCANYILKKCRRHQCDLLHSRQRLPYVWQVRLFGCTWKTFECQEDIERAFCGNKDTFRLTQNRLKHKEITLVVRSLKFAPIMQAEVYVVGGNGNILSLTCRRVTTVSYKEVIDQLSGFETQWRWYWEDNSRWNLYEPDGIQHTLEEKFVLGQIDYHFFGKDASHLYRVTFGDMHQVNVETLTSRSINRRPIFVSGSDILHKQIPESLTPVPPVLTVPPPYWVSLDHAFPFELVRIPVDSQEFGEITGDFFKTLDKNDWKIDSVYRLQNPSLWSSFSHQEKLMEEKAKREGLSGTNKMRLYHGTDSLDSVYGICLNNFDFRLSGKNATAFGQGAYFAKDSSYSHKYTLKKGDTSKSDDSGAPLRHIFVAPVLVGKYTKGSSSDRRPPHKPGNQHDLYDSCVDNADEPTIFVIFDKTQCYPGYLIIYCEII